MQRRRRFGGLLIFLVARTSATRWGALTARQRSCAAMISLSPMASPAAFEPGPRVIFVRCRTVAKVDPMGRGPQMHPVLGRVVVEGEQLPGVVGELGDRLGELRAVRVAESADRLLRMGFVFRAPDPGQVLIRRWMRQFGHRGLPKP